MTLSGEITGLPNMLCSNGDPVILSGNPSGGTFFAQDSVGTMLPTVMSGDTLYPQLLPFLNYNNGIQNIDIVYSFIESYTNGNN